MVVTGTLWKLLEDYFDRISGEDRYTALEELEIVPHDTAVILQDTTGYYRILQDTTRYYTILQNTTGY